MGFPVMLVAYFSVCYVRKNVRTVILAEEASETINPLARILTFYAQHEKRKLFFKIKVYSTL